MGVPAFFRWLSRKYPSIVVHCVEEKNRTGANGEKIPIDSSKPNPNDIEFDNLYLDMNGIIHPCCHPENKAAPKNEDEMMQAIFEYIDRLFAIVRPRKLLYMAIDGVAPRAKMNQQRSRRFRASKESYEKKLELEQIRSEMESKGFQLPPTKSEGEHFDSNCITPGTPFMFRLAECLRFYIHDRLQNDPGWKTIKVILSDANVPGEGEHKIMDYIRKQRAQPDHDPNTRHCLCGADADLIMLGLATHELEFTIIREEFKPNQPRPCEICAQVGHEAKECTGVAREKRGEHDEFASSSISSDVDFIFLRLCVLREYLERDLRLDGLPFKYDFERVLDDWVFMCFYVGNDFLPHLPSLEIREGAIDRLVKIYKETIYKMGGYLADAGDVNMSRVQVILTTLGTVEDEIFKNRRETELEFRKRDEQKKRQQQQWKKPAFMMQGQYAPQPVGKTPAVIVEPRQVAAEGRLQAVPSSANKNDSNQDAAAALRSMLYQDGEQPSSASSGRNGNQKSPSSANSAASTVSSPPGPVKRKSDAQESANPEDESDDVRLWEDGWKDRYYRNKFGVGADDMAFRGKVAAAYARGLCWVLRYYYQGCASWDWYFPYHYAPFASDFVNIGDLPNDFEKDTQPFNPLEQLMAVFPAASRQHVPGAWQHLMFDPESPIIDFYPTNFKVDLNGKKFAWMGVALLPFVDEKRLLGTLRLYYKDLTEAEKLRNVRGEDRLFVGKHHASYDFLSCVYEDKNGDSASLEQRIELATRLCDGMLGTVWACEFSVMRGATLQSPLAALEDLQDTRVASVKFKDPQYSCEHIFLAKVLTGAKPPTAALKPDGLIKDRQGNYRPQLGFQQNSGYRNNKDASSAQRMVTNSLMGSYNGKYSNVGPPSNSFGRPSSLLGQPSGHNAAGYVSRSVPLPPQVSHSSQGGGGVSAWQRNMQGQANAYQGNWDRGQAMNPSRGQPPPLVPEGYHPYRTSNDSNWNAPGAFVRRPADYGAASYGYQQPQRPVAPPAVPSYYSAPGPRGSNASHQSRDSYNRNPLDTFPRPSNYYRQ